MLEYAMSLPLSFIPVSHLPSLPLHSTSDRFSASLTFLQQKALARSHSRSKEEERIALSEKMASFVVINDSLIIHT